MIAGKRFSAKSVATLRRIAAMPRDVRDLTGGTLYVLAAHRAINIKDGFAVITRTGVRQLRNLS
jgi:hypothetical protein